MQVLIPRQAVLFTSSQKGVQAVQALIPRQEVPIFSPGGVQAMQVLILRQAVLFPSSQEGVQAFIPRQAMLVTPGWEEVGKSGAISHGNSSSISIY